MGVPGSGVRAALSLGKLGLPLGSGDLGGGLAFPELLGRGGWPPAGVGTEKQAHLSPLDTVWSSGSPATSFPETPHATDCWPGQVGRLVVRGYDGIS